MDADQIIREHMTYAQRVAELEAEGLTTSDAQGVADAEQMKGRVFAEDAAHPNDDAVIREHMRKGGGRQSAVVDRALKLVAGGMTPYAAAKKVGIALSTIYRAIERQKRR